MYRRSEQTPRGAGDPRLLTGTSFYLQVWLLFLSALCISLQVRELFLTTYFSSYIKIASS